MSSRGVFFFVSVRAEESRRAPLLKLIPASKCCASHELSRSSIISTGRPSAFSTRAAKLLRFFRHFARSAVQVQRQPNDDPLHSLLPRQFAQAGEIAPAVDPRPGSVRPGSHAKFIRKRQPHPLFAVIDRENHTFSMRFGRQGQSTEGNRHNFIITRKEGFSEARVMLLLQ